MPLLTERHPVLTQCQLTIEPFALGLYVQTYTLLWHWCWSVGALSILYLFYWLSGFPIVSEYLILISKQGPKCCSLPFFAYHSVMCEYSKDVLLSCSMCWSFKYLSWSIKYSSWHCFSRNYPLAISKLGCIVNRRYYTLCNTHTTILHSL